MIKEKMGLTATTNDSKALDDDKTFLGMKQFYTEKKQITRLQNTQIYNICEKSLRNY